MSPELLKLLMSGELLEKVLMWAGALSALLGASYGVALLIPGEQPDKSIKWLMNITDMMSRKKKPESKQQWDYEMKNWK